MFILYIYGNNLVLKSIALIHMSHVVYRISMAMGLYYYGLRETTATYATNFLNLIPITTFILSTILRYLQLYLVYCKLMIIYSRV